MEPKAITVGKAIAITVGIGCAALMAALLVALAKVAGGVLLVLLAMMTPFVLFGATVYLVYKYLDNR